MTAHRPTLARIARRTTLSAVAVSVAATGTAAAQGGHGGGMGGMGGGVFGFGGLAGLFWMGLLVAVPLLIVYALANGGSDDRPAVSDARNSEDALSVLRERYARGDLSEEEFERRRDRLR